MEAFWTDFWAELIRLGLNGTTVARIFMTVTPLATVGLLVFGFFWWIDRD